MVPAGIPMRIDLDDFSLRDVLIVPALQGIGRIFVKPNRGKGQNVQ